MTELITMTSSTGSGDFDAAGLLDSHTTSGQAFGRPAAILVGTLLAFQCANIAQVATADVDTKSSIQLTSAVRADLFGDLLEFHQTLANSQQDLPEEAARLLRENLWQLYD